ncbi:MAG: hypothetical protein H6799_00245 [Candidatus Nomurabacteria bacterium]|nr:MAG: hypothetical protein H6799_00245 [Candidatus Nomurabacteria bacterium]HRV76018.1 hypothetical protein [Candidatus Saccharimonadales bacterium]
MDILKSLLANGEDGCSVRLNDAICAHGLALAALGLAASINKIPNPVRIASGMIAIPIAANLAYIVRGGLKD